MALSNHPNVLGGAAPGGETTTDASLLTSGTVAPARLGSGSGSNTKFLREDSTFQEIPGGGDALTSSGLNQFAATTSDQLRGVISNETGTGALVFATSPTLVTPLLGTPTSGTLTNCTGLPQAGTVGLTTADSPQFAGVNIGHATDTTITRVSAGLIAVEGATVYAQGGALGTPASGTLTNCTGLPEAGVTGLTTALGVRDATVVHGGTAGTARPSGVNAVTWIGSVSPNNASNNDRWIQTA
jgi:hypothetical protein